MTTHFIKQKDFSSKFQRFKGRAPVSGVGFLVDVFMLVDTLVALLPGHA